MVGWGNPDIQPVTFTVRLSRYTRTRLEEEMARNGFDLENLLRRMIHGYLATILRPPMKINDNQLREAWKTVGGRANTSTN